MLLYLFTLGEAETGEILSTSGGLMSSFMPLIRILIGVFIGLIIFSFLMRAIPHYLEARAERRQIELLRKAGWKVELPTALEVAEKEMIKKLKKKGYEITR